MLYEKKSYVDTLYFWFPSHWSMPAQLTDHKSVTEKLDTIDFAEWKRRRSHFSLWLWRGTDVGGVRWPWLFLKPSVLIPDANDFFPAVMLDGY